MLIEQADAADAAKIAAVLNEAAQCLARDGRPLWSAAEVGYERVLSETTSGLFHVAREGDELAGVMKFELEDAYFWPEVESGSSAFVHKLAVGPAWAKKGVSAALLSYAQTRARNLVRAHLRLDCVADREGLRKLYEEFGFTLHSVVQIGGSLYARYELRP